MDSCNCSVKKNHPIRKNWQKKPIRSKIEWPVATHLLKQEGPLLQRMNDCKWYIEKKNIVLTEIWWLKQILVAVPVKKTTVIWKKINAISSPKGQLFWRSPLQMPTIAFLKDLRYLIKSYNCCCEILKLTCSPWNKEITASSFVHFKSRMAFLK